VTNWDKGAPTFNPLVIENTWEKFVCGIY
jgi:hypothetical protein